MSERRPLLAVDGDNLCHRAYHALPPITGSGERPVNALLGFANMLLQVVAAERPRAVVVGWDTLGEPSYRNRLYPPYQAQRPAFDEALLEQLERGRELVSAFGYANARAPGYEADDFLAAAARAEVADGGTALVLTNDRDAYQLAAPGVTLLVPAGAGRELTRVGVEEVRERYGVEPAQVPDFVALRGDPSDNLPGASGIGAKTAAALLKRYGDLETVMAEARGLTPRQAMSLRDQLLPVYKRIATMDAAAPLELPADTALDAEGAARFADEIGTRRLAERLRELA